MNFPVELNHVLIYVSDVKKSLKFYQSLLGFEIIEEMDGYARLCTKSKTTTIGLHEIEKDKEYDEIKTLIRLYFEVLNLDEFYHELISKGIKFIQEPRDMPWGWRHAYLKDPDGYEISLYYAGEKRFSPSPS